MNYNNSYNNDHNNNDEYKIQLYNSVFNNIYLKKIILYHLNIFNILNNRIEFISIEEWKEFKYKEYLNRVAFDFKYDIDLNQLPPNIRHIDIAPSNDITSTIPNHIDSISISSLLHYSKITNQYSYPSITTTTSKFSILYLELNNNFQLYKQIELIPQSITDLNIYSNGYKIKLSKGLLPIGLKRLSIIGNSEDGGSAVTCEDGCFPESLTQVRFECTDPIVINQLSTLPNLIELKFTTDRDDDFNKTSIDNNIIFPTTLLKLSIECRSFNSKLPDHLKSFTIEMERFNHKIQFPPSLENISIRYDNEIDKVIFKTQQSVPPNLKSLSFQCSSIVDSKGQSIIPNKLESLFINESSFNQIIQINQLPSSLTHLQLFGEFNKVINVNVLPSTLKKLLLGPEYTKAINPLAIPHQLELLHINNFRYNRPINLSPSTHPNTLIYCNDLNLYYQVSNTDICVLRLPDTFNSPLSTLQLQDKSNLKYLHLGGRFDHPIQLSDLPINNQIKTLELGSYFNRTINLEYFQNLETIIINVINNYRHPKITTTIDNINNKYNNYNLKNIIIPSYHTKFIKQLDINFYQFIKNNK